MQAEHEQQQCQSRNKLTYAEKLNLRIATLQSTMQRTTKLCDRLRNLNEIKLANESDRTVQFEVECMKAEVNNELQWVYAQTEIRLSELRKPQPHRLTTTTMATTSYAPAEQHTVVQNITKSKQKIDKKPRKSKSTSTSKKERQ